MESTIPKNIGVIHLEDKRFTILVAVIEAVLAFVVGIALFKVQENDMRQEVVNSISQYLDEVDRNSSLEEALQAIYRESQEKSTIISQLETENEKLKSELVAMQKTPPLEDSPKVDTDIPQEDKPYSYYLMVDEDSAYYIDGTTGDYYHWKNSCYDTEKNLRENVIYYPFGEVSTKIILNGEFAKATGTFFYFLEQLENGRSGSLKIYGDGELLYGATIDVNTPPIDLDIDLSGVIYLTVEMKTGSSSDWISSTSGEGYAGISNFNLYKTITS